MCVWGGGCVIIRAKYLHINILQSIWTLYVAALDAEARVIDHISKIVTLRYATDPVLFSYLVPTDNSNSVTAKNCELIFGFKNGE